LIQAGHEAISQDDVRALASWFAEPNWRPASRCQRLKPPALKPWLLDQGSLTAKLLHASAGDLRVRLLAQGFARPRRTERLALGMAGGHYALVREVVLQGRGQNWVFARSLIPATSLTGRLRQLRWLRERPLGGFLFAQPDLKRGVMELSDIGPEHRYLPPGLKVEGRLWGRRSVFWLEAKPLLVSETFLPDFARGLSS